MTEMLAAASLGILMAPVLRWIAACLPQRIEQEFWDAITEGHPGAVTGGRPADGPPLAQILRSHWARRWDHDACVNDFLVAIAFGACSIATVGPSVVLALILSAAIALLVMVDRTAQYLPDDVTLPLMWIGLAVSAVGLGPSPQEAIFGAVLGYCFPWAIYHAYRMLRGIEGMGYGDFKMLAAIGAWVGWQGIPYVILAAAILACVVMGALIGVSRDHRFAFGPFIGVAGWVWYLWGTSLRLLLP